LITITNNTYKMEQNDNTFSTLLRLSDVYKSFPTIDGHFWVERDGEIIDPHFDKYDVVKKIHSAVGTKNIHLPADNMTQKIMIAIFDTKITKNGYKNRDDFTNDLISVGYKRYGLCFTNALMEIQENGGNLIFGSWGFPTKYKGDFYEFGGADWKGVSAFLRL